MLEAKDNYYTPLVSSDEETRNVKDNLHVISNLLDTLQRIHVFIERSGKVISLLLKQICAILGQGFYTTNTTSFPVIQIFQNNNMLFFFISNIYF